MNAEAYLRKQGWQGSGHSLDGEGRGIKKPLLIAHKQDQLGLGKKKAAYTTDDQWWMRAFDDSLKNIGTGQESTLSQIQKKGINRGGLYGFFVKGESIAGTLGDSEDSSTAPTEASAAPSGTSTPATSASDSEPTRKAVDKKNKRKRDAEDETSKAKKSKSKKNKRSAVDKEAKKLAKKIAKLTVDEKATYEKRAAAKGQSLEVYVARRIQKKDDQRATR
jgi:nucleolar protein TMA23